MYVYIRYMYMCMCKHICRYKYNLLFVFLHPYPPYILEWGLASSNCSKNIS